MEFRGFSFVVVSVLVSIIITDQPWYSFPLTVKSYCTLSALMIFAECLHDSDESSSPHTADQMTQAVEDLNGTTTASVEKVHNTIFALTIILC